MDTECIHHCLSVPCFCLHGSRGTRTLVRLGGGKERERIVRARNVWKDGGMDMDRHKGRSMSYGRISIWPCSDLTREALHRRHFRRHPRLSLQVVRLSNSSSSTPRSARSLDPVAHLILSPQASLIIPSTVQPGVTVIQRVSIEPTRPIYLLDIIQPGHIMIPTFHTLLPRPMCCAFT